MKNCKRLTGPRLANSPDRLVSRSLKTKSRPHLQLIHRRASSLLFVASDMQQELLHRVLHTNALKRSSLLPANPHMGLNCSKEKETPQLHLFAAMNHDRPPRRQLDGKSPQTADCKAFPTSVSVNGFSSRTSQGVGCCLIRFSYQAPIGIKAL